MRKNEFVACVVLICMAGTVYAEEYVAVWNYPTGSGVWTVSISSDGKYTAAGSYDNNVYLFDSTGKLLGKYKTAYYVSSVATSRDGNYTAAGSYDSNVYFFNKVQPIVEVPKLPKLSAVKSVRDSVIVEGESTIVEINLQNTGEGKAGNVRFNDPIPDGLELVEGSTAWSGELKPNESAVISYKVRAQKLARPENTTYQLPRLEVAYEDLHGKAYRAESAFVFLTATPKIVKVEPPPAPKETLRERVLRMLYARAGIMYASAFLIGALVLRTYINRIRTERRRRTLKQIKQGVEAA